MLKEILLEITQWDFVSVVMKVFLKAILSEGSSFEIAKLHGVSYLLIAYCYNFFF